MKHIDYLFENAHPGGTYASLIPSIETKEALFRFCSDIGIPNLVDTRDYHMTLVYSKKAVPDIIHEDFDLPIEALMKGFKILGDEKKVLVIELYCPGAKRLHELFQKKYGATHDYPDFIPHITVAEDYEGDDVPADMFEGEIIFSGEQVSELD